MEIAVSCPAVPVWKEIKILMISGIYSEEEDPDDYHFPLTLRSPLVKKQSVSVNGEQTA